MPAPPATDDRAMLVASGISKAYGGVKALSGANLRVRAGSVHALLGENGAGKSTLVKIVAGAIRQDSGTLSLDGREVSFDTTAQANRQGVAVVAQELSLFPDLDVLSNLFPMREIKRGPFVSRAAMARKARPVLEEIGLEVSLRQSVGSLSLGQRQQVEIAKALVTDPRLLILDEPTSALEAQGTETLLRVLSALRERQVAVLFVSHILEEVMALCDEVTVLRDGRPVLEGISRQGLTVDSVVDAMLGDRARREHALANVATPDVSDRISDTAVATGTGLQIKNVTLGHELTDVSFSVAPGEILGVAGVAGSGHLTTIQLISGQRRSDSGEIILPNGRPVPRGLRNAVGSGIAFVTGDRRRFGLMLDKPLWDNIAQVRAVALAGDGIVIRKAKLREAAEEHMKTLRVRAASVDALAGSLSGGNQQKIVFAKWLDAKPSLLLLDDPTRGVDVGAKAEMHELIRAATRGGAVTVLASTDLEELETLCDRVLIFYRGRVAVELRGDDLTTHEILVAMNTGRLEHAAA
jgi:ABC-type sugar transport system ATPase subunit